MIAAIAGLLLTLAGGLAMVPWLMHGRTVPGAYVGTHPMTGLTPDDLRARLRAYNTELQSQPITITIRGQTKQYTFADLGITLDIQATSDQPARKIKPQLQINAPQLQATIARDFATVVTVPRSASLRLTNQGYVEQLPSKSGEGIDLAIFQQQLGNSLQSTQSISIEPPISAVGALLIKADTTAPAAFATSLLRTGLTLSFADRTWIITPFTLRRLLVFTEQPISSPPGRYRLSIQLNETGLADYLTTALAPEINRPAQDARFAINENGKVERVAAAKTGTTLDVPQSLRRINTALEHYKSHSELVVIKNEPAVQNQTDVESLDLTALLATGTTDFVGSPTNRMHNIKVGTARYHGLLIPPGAIFSFNQFLGPVNAQAGYKPELVIKHDRTIPEYGGGLCQVSTTLFRVAAQAGLGITERRNHAYAVRYYGTPGFDATIYPPNTDFKFTNDTDSYLLMQTKIEGTKLSIELWGKTDGRQVTIDGPHPYDRQPDGAVKATLKRTVRRGDAVLHNDTFYSRYRSPSLFPKPNENPLP